jgi:hypothetical protein
VGFYPNIILFIVSHNLRFLKYHEPAFCLKR